MKQILMIALLITLGACEQAAEENVTHTAADLMALDSEFSDYSLANGPHAAFDKYLVDDVIGLPEGQDFSFDKATTLAGFAGFPETATLTWVPAGGDISTGGDLGYTFGRYIVNSTTPEGDPRQSHGKYVTIWKLQADGSWKAVLDGGNSNPPPAAEGAE